MIANIFTINTLLLIIEAAVNKLHLVLYCVSPSEAISINNKLQALQPTIDTPEYVFIT